MEKVKKGILILTFILIALIAGFYIDQKITDFHNKLTTMLASASLIFTVLNFILISLKSSAIEVVESYANEFLRGVENHFKISLCNTGALPGSIKLTKILYLKGANLRSKISFRLFGKIPKGQIPITNSKRGYLNIPPYSTKTIKVPVIESFEDGLLFLKIENIKCQKRRVIVAFKINK